MKNIGPTFPNELESAGLLGMPFSWGSNGEISFSENMTKSQKAAVLAVYEAHDPAAQLPVDTETRAVEKLRQFLADNPDVASVVGAGGAQ